MCFSKWILYVLLIYMYFISILYLFLNFSCSLLYWSSSSLSFCCSASSFCSAIQTYYMESMQKLLISEFVNITNIRLRKPVDDASIWFLCLRVIWIPSGIHTFSLSYLSDMMNMHLSQYNLLLTSSNFYKRNTVTSLLTTTLNTTTSRKRLVCKQPFCSHSLMLTLAWGCHSICFRHEVTRVYVFLRSLLRNID